MFHIGDLGGWMWKWMLMCIVNSKSDSLVRLFTNLYLPNSARLSYLVSNSAWIIASVGPQEADGNGDAVGDLLIWQDVALVQLSLLYVGFCLYEIRRKMVGL